MIGIQRPAADRDDRPIEPGPRRSGPLRALYLVLGLLFTALGLIGAVLPIMPTTIFLVLAAACFARSSPRLERWILDHPVFGPPVAAWRDHGVIGRGAKWASIVMMWGGFAVTVVLNIMPLLGYLALAAVLAAVSVFVASRPSVIPPSPT